MSDDEKPRIDGPPDAAPDGGAPDEDGADVPDETADDPMRALLRRSLATPASEAPPGAAGRGARDPDLLRAVQRKIRVRSNGKFFADGWSTTSSRINHALVAAVMLLVVALCYFVLGPMGVTH